MKDRSPNQIPAMLVILALTGLAASAIAEEPPAKQETAGEQNAKRPKNLLKWSTATESDNFGYDIYRGDSEDGPFERLNPDPILGAGTTDKRSTYEFVDDTIEPDTTYWYYLESISMSGVKERFTSVFKKEPKSKQASSEPESDPEEGEGDPGRD